MSSPTEPVPPKAPELDRRGLLASVLLSLSLAIAVCWDALVAGRKAIVGAAWAEIWPFLFHHGWMAHAIVEEHRWPFRTTWLDHPDGGVLWLKDGFSTFLLLPLNLAFGPETAFDASVLMHFTLAGAAAFLLSRELGASRQASVLLAPAYAFHPYALGEAHNGNIEALSIAFPVLWAWALLRVLHRPTPGRAVFAGVMLGLLAFINQYWLIAMVPVSAVFLAVDLIRPGASRGRRLLALSAAVLLGGLLTVPTALGIQANLDAPDSLSFFDTGGLDLFPPLVTDLRQMFLPDYEYKGGHLLLNLHDIAYPTYGLLLAALLGPLLARPRRWAIALTLLGLTFVVFSMGPVAYLDGEVLHGSDGRPLWLPWAYVSELPLIGTITLPHRFAPIAAMALVPLGALVLSRLEGVGRLGRAASVVLCLGLWAEIAISPNYNLPLVTTDLRRPAASILLHELPGQEAVLALPMRFRANNAREALWWQMIQDRPSSQHLRVGAPPRMARAIPGIQRLHDFDEAVAHGGGIEDVPDLPEQTRQQLLDHGYGYVIVHLPSFMGMSISSPEEQELVVEAYMQEVEATLGPGFVLPDARVVYVLDPEQRPAALAKARELFGEDQVQDEVPPNVFIEMFDAVMLWNHRDFE